MGSKFQFKGLALLLTGLFITNSPTLAQSNPGPVVIYNCTDGMGQLSVDGELALLICPNNQYTNYPSPWEYRLGPSCDSSAQASLGNLSDTQQVTAHFTLLKETGSNNIRVCWSNLSLLNPATSSIIAASSQGSYAPQNCGIQMEQGTIIRSHVYSSIAQVHCSFTFDLSSPFATPTPVPSVTVTPTATVSRTATRTRTPTPPTSSTPTLNPTRTATRTATKTRTATPAAASSSSAVSSSSEQGSSSSSGDLPVVIE